MSRSTLVLTAGVVTVGAQAFLLAPLLPDVATGLATTPAAVARALGGYGAGVVASALLLAPRLDRLPRRAVLVLGTLALAAGAAGSALAPSWPLLAVAQAVAGAGVGVVLPATYALAAELAPPGGEARATGRVLTGWSIALVAGVPAAAALGDAVGWRGAFALLAVLAGLQALLHATLPAPAAPPGRVVRTRLRDAWRAPGTARMLGAVGAVMVAFYGVFAFLGTEARALHGGGAVTAGAVALAYGVGFGLGTLGDRWLHRGWTAPGLAALAACYAGLAAAPVRLPVLLALAVLWGAVNHTVITLLVSGLATAPEARGAVLALNTAATYGAVAVAGVVAGPLHAVGFWVLALGAAGVVALAVPLVARDRVPDRAGAGG
jgi:predicted MFS family arabinose efflux permease